MKSLTETIEDIVSECGSDHFSACDAPYEGEISGRLHLCGCHIGDQNRKLLQAIHLLVQDVLTREITGLELWAKELDDVRFYIHNRDWYACLESQWRAAGLRMAIQQLQGGLDER